MKIFITGIAGTIGSTLLDRLLFEDCTVSGIDNLSSGDIRRVQDNGMERCVVFRSPVQDLGSYIDYLSTCDVVIHMAASMGVQKHITGGINH